jgi:NitT/TauT family transport system ATP-binding protein
MEGGASARTGRAPAIVFESVTKSFVTARKQLAAVGPVDLRARSGEFVAFVGPSGCGKTTLLNLAAGFEKCTLGRVSVDGVEVSAPATDRVMIFQEPALFPWLDVLDNVAFGLRHLPGFGARERREAARRFLALVHLESFAHAYVHELSGGMKQRAAWARALATRPGVLLCDEPFGSLDALTRERLYAQVQELHAELGTTILFVTHNTREAACLADRVVVLTSRPARIKREVTVDLSRPRDFYDPRVSRLAGEILAELRGELPPDSGDGV